MAVYLVAFQIDEDNLEEQDYEDLGDVFDEYDDYCQIFDELWAVVSDDSADEIHENFAQHLYEGDFILVTKMREDYRGFLPESVVDWLDENL